MNTSQRMIRPSAAPYDGVVAWLRAWDASRLAASPHQPWAGASDGTIYLIAHIMVKLRRSYDLGHLTEYPKGDGR